MMSSGGNKRKLKVAGKACKVRQFSLSGVEEGQHALNESYEDCKIEENNQQHIGVVGGDLVEDL
jgi:hypothetical protein